MKPINLKFTETERTRNFKKPVFDFFFYYIQKQKMSGLNKKSKMSILDIRIKVPISGPINI